MDLQEYLNLSVSRSVRTDMRAKNAITLGELLCELSKYQDEPISFDTGGSPSNAHSYRGYYEHLALSNGGSVTMTCAEAAAIFRACLGQTFCGYKGGDYTMTKDTLLFRAEYGSCGRLVVGVRRDGERVVIETRDTDE